MYRLIANPLGSVDADPLLDEGDGASEAAVGFVEGESRVAVGGGISITTSAETAIALMASRTLFSVSRAMLLARMEPGRRRG